VFRSGKHKAGRQFLLPKLPCTLQPEKHIKKNLVIAAISLLAGTAMAQQQSDCEVDFQGRATPDDLTPLGLRQMGLHAWD
jgi:hypothetical protein